MNSVGEGIFGGFNIDQEVVSGLQSAWFQEAVRNPTFAAFQVLQRSSLQFQDDDLGGQL